MSTTVRTVLVFLAAATAAFAAAPPVDLPGWAAALIAALAAGFAGLGILPPAWVQSGTHTAVKRNRPTRAQELGQTDVKRKHELPTKLPSGHIKAVRARLAAALIAVAAVFGVLNVTSAQAYIHEANAREYCRAWNNQSATDNIRYVEDSMVRPHWTITNVYFASTRYGNNDLTVYPRWHEWLEVWQGRLAIDYACRVGGSDDAHMYMQSIGGSAVFWI